MFKTIVLSALLLVGLALAIAGTQLRPQPDYISIIVAESNCGEFHAALLIRPDGTIKEEHDIGLAVEAAKTIPVEHGIKVMDGPCKKEKL